MKPVWRQLKLAMGYDREIAVSLDTELEWLQQIFKGSAMTVYGVTHMIQTDVQCKIAAVGYEMKEDTERVEIIEIWGCI